MKPGIAKLVVLMLLLIGLALGQQWTMFDYAKKVTPRSSISFDKQPYSGNLVVFMSCGRSSELSLTHEPSVPPNISPGTWIIIPEAHVERDGQSCDMAWTIARRGQQKITFSGVDSDFGAQVMEINGIPTWFITKEPSLPIPKELR